MAIQNFYEAKVRCLKAPVFCPVAVFKTRQAGIFKTTFADTLGTQEEIRKDPESFLGVFSQANHPQEIHEALTYGKPAHAV